MLKLNHRIVRLAIAFAFGLFVSYCSYQWITDEERPQRRAQEEGVVLASRDILRQYIVVDGLEISDALDRVKAAGKVYIYPTSAGWELSGHYRRAGETVWHDYLLALDVDRNLVSLFVNDTDPELIALAAADSKFSTATP